MGDPKTDAGRRDCAALAALQDNEPGPIDGALWSTGVSASLERPYIEAFLLAMVVSLPVPIVCWVMGASPDVRVGAFAAGIVAVYPVAFLWLRARRRREWAKEWQGPARMFRAMPLDPHGWG